MWDSAQGRIVRAISHNLLFSRLPIAQNAQFRLEVVSASRLVQNVKHLLKLILFSWPVTSNKCLADRSIKQTLITIILLKQCRSKLVAQFENGLSF